MANFVIGLIFLMAAVGTADHNAEMPLIGIAAMLFLGSAFIVRGIYEKNRF